MIRQWLTHSLGPPQIPLARESRVSAALCEANGTVPKRKTLVQILFDKTNSCRDGCSTNEEQRHCDN
jgi:hypothetical protein